MGWFAKVVSIIAGPVAGAAAGVVVEKEKPGDAVKDAVLAPVTVPVSTVATVDSRIGGLEGELVRRIGGQKAKNFIIDLQRITRPLGTTEASGLVSSVEEFVKTGDVGLLDPLILPKRKLRRSTPPR